MSDDPELDRLRASLDALATGVEAPDDEELARMARAASSAPRPAAPRFAPRPVPAAVVGLAASAAVAVLAVTTLGSDPGSRNGSTGTTDLVSFPEGSALRLLTSTSQGDTR